MEVCLYPTRVAGPADSARSHHSITCVCVSGLRATKTRQHGASAPNASKPAIRHKDSFELKVAVGQFYTIGAGLVGCVCIDFIVVLSKIWRMKLLKNM